MEAEYIPIKPEDIFPRIDSETIAKFLKGESESKKHQIETIDYLLNSLSIAKEKIFLYVRHALLQRILPTAFRVLL